MDIKSECNELAKNFIENPANYVTEADLVLDLVSILRKNHSPTEIDDGEIKNKADGYKKSFPDTIEDKMEEFNPVHLEVSTNKGERIDLVVFNEDINGFYWVSNGSKRFCDKYIGAAVEVKFVKNKRYFPKKKGETNEKVKDYDKNTLKEEVLDLGENSIKDDLKELSNLDTDDVYLLIFSNNDYLYTGREGKLTQKEKNYRHIDLYEKMGNAAKEKINDFAEEKEVSVLYIHPRMRIKGDYSLYSD